jgi:hypothetical protein
MTAEEERTRLIGEIARVLRDGPVPDEARCAALTLIGWLARRMPGEPVSICDLTRCTGLHGRHPHGARLDGGLAASFSPMDDPPVSTVNGPGRDGGYPHAPAAAEAPVSRRSRSAR